MMAPGPQRGRDLRKRRYRPSRFMARRAEVARRSFDWPQGPAELWCVSDPMPGHTRPAPARDHAHTTKTAVDPTCSVCAIRDAYQPRFSTRPRAPSGITIDDLGRDPPKWRDILTRSATGGGGRMAGPTKRDPQGPRQRLHHDRGGPSQRKWRDRPWQEQAPGPQRGTDQPNHSGPQFPCAPASIRLDAQITEGRARCLGGS